MKEEAERKRRKTKEAEAHHAGRDVCLEQDTAAAVVLNAPELAFPNELDRLSCKPAKIGQPRGQQDASGDEICCAEGEEAHCSGSIGGSNTPVVRKGAVWTTRGEGAH